VKAYSRIRNVCILLLPVEESDSVAVRTPYSPGAMNIAAWLLLVWNLLRGRPAALSIYDPQPIPGYAHSALRLGLKATVGSGPL